MRCLRAVLPMTVIPCCQSSFHGFCSLEKSVSTNSLATAQTSSLYLFIFFPVKLNPFMRVSLLHVPLPPFPPSLCHSHTQGNYFNFYAQFCGKYACEREKRGEAREDREKSKVREWIEGERE